MLFLSALISVVAIIAVIITIKIAAMTKKESMKEAAAQMGDLDEEIDRCIKKLRDSTRGTEVRTYVTEYEELMFKKSDEIIKMFIRK